MTYPESDLLREFEARTLDPSTFSHRRHLEVAFEMLRKYPFLEAVTQYSENIDAIASAAGASQKFNLTITLAFLSLIAERMETATHTDFEAFLAKNEDLLDTGLMSRWYSRPRLQQDHARTHFLMPDLTG